ncbi:MAG TPA: hypothetical protein VFZ34_02590 [Blastocatellia bacterium]|nr:hypothetical protein [Blastocatellia bacterium]
MGYNYSKQLQPIGQADTMSCWAACISWWTTALALTTSSGRRSQDQLALLTKYSHLVSGNGGMSPSNIRRVCEDAEIRIDLKYITPSEFKTWGNLDAPHIIVFKYPEVGGTHMNVIFNQKGSMVECMEPYYPLNPTNGRFTGKYLQRPLSFYLNSPEIGVGGRPLSDYK